MQIEAVRHEHGLCGQWFWLQTNLTDGQSLSLFSFTDYLVPLAPMLPPLSLTDEDISLVNRG